jgi:hypothetical protein
MAEALEWIQCKGCGRRHRWRAEIAGQEISCTCGKPVPVPEGPTSSLSSAGRTAVGQRATKSGSISDTFVEDAESAANYTPDLYEAPPIPEEWERASASAALAPGQPRPLTPMERKAANQFLVWTLAALFSLAMVVHVIFLAQYWPKFWWYTAAAVIAGPVSLFKFSKAKRRWQQGRPFWSALMHTLGTE